ncbi:MAG TPA: DUF3572 domain-containing protein [Telmatospirillum sp.]|nr:DUF3572 domain-containing protein [Telmatospirillum sp.]
MDPFKPYQPKPKAAALRPLSVEEAEVIALKAVAFIAGDEDLLPRLFALTGCGADDLKSRIADRTFLGAVLDFLLADEPSLIRFASAVDLAPEAPMLARAVLSPDAMDMTAFDN